MADMTTAIISGTFAIAGSLGSVWLKDYLERNRQRAPAATPSAPAPAPPSGAAASVPVASAAQGIPGAEATRMGTERDRPTSKRRPLYVAAAGFALGIISSLARPYFAGQSHPEAMTALALLIFGVLAAIVYHAKPGADRGLALYQLEVFSLWAAYACGWSIVYGRLWSDFVGFAAAGWLGSGLAGLVLIPLLRRDSARRT
jgi:hypothetical protein